jgi:5-methylcytosine-specific restriction protein A
VAKTYNRKWAALSKRFLAAHPQCNLCGQPSKHVDHVTPVSAQPWLKFESGNLQALCHGCHNRITAAYDRGASLLGACDDDGNPLDPTHPWHAASNLDAIARANAPASPSPRFAAQAKRNAIRKVVPNR